MTKRRITITMTIISFAIVKKLCRGKHGKWKAENNLERLRSYSSSLVSVSDLVYKEKNFGHVYSSKSC